jgi:DNA-binding MarR family transcriptional regulator
MDSEPGQNPTDGHAKAPPRLVPDRHASFLVVALANRLSASASRAYMRQFGVGVMEWRAMALLAGNPGITANQIAHTSGVDKSAVSRAIHLLVKRGDVHVAEDQSDNRRALLTLTPAGLALHDRIIFASLERERLLLTGLNDKERAALFDLLKRLNVNMSLVAAHEPEKHPA